MKIIHYIFFIMIFMTFHHTIVAVNDTTQFSLQEKIEQLQKQKDELEIQLNQNLTDEQQQNILQQIIDLENEIHTQKLLLTNEQSQKITSPFWKKAALVLIGVIFTIITGKILWNQNVASKPSILVSRQWLYTPADYSVIDTPIPEPDFTTAPEGHYTLIIDKGKLGRSREGAGLDDFSRKNFTTNFTEYQTAKPTTPTPPQTQPTGPVAQPQQKIKWTYTYRGHTVKLPGRPDFDTCPPGKYTAVREVDPFNRTKRNMDQKQTREINEYDPSSRDWAKKYFKDFL